MKTISKYIILIFAILQVCHLSAIAQQKLAKGGYGDMLYPYAHDYSQTLSYKISVDYGKTSEIKKLDATKVLQIIERIDNITRGIPKIVYIVGWQYTGHDTGYPSFSKVNPVLKRENDQTALESLRWLMTEGPKFHTTVSLHVNFSDCYLDDNTLGPKYKERDIIVRETDGKHRQGYEWNGHMAYRASNYRNWYQGTFRNDQIDPLFEMIPELKISGTLHPDAWYNTDNPYYQIDSREDCLGMREMTVYLRKKYNVDLTTEFDWGRPEGEDFVLYHPMIWHMGWNVNTPPDPMKIPPYFMTGGDAFFWNSEELSKTGKFFGHSSTFESEINESIVEIPGALKSFATRTLPWYFMNRLLREDFQSDTAWFSGEVVVTNPGKVVIKQSGNYLQNGNDIFIPALWKAHPEIIAYSENGYKNRTWTFPESWEKVKKVDIYQLTTEGVKKKKREVSVSSDRKITLSCAPDEGLVIVPSNVNPETVDQAKLSGQVEFLGTDTKTKGFWKGIYGEKGYIIPGVGEKIPTQIEISVTNGENRIWKGKTKDIQAIQIPGEDDRIASSRSHQLHEIVDFNFTDGQEHEVAIYFLDWDRRGRWSVIDILDPHTYQVLHSYNLTDFDQGVYLKYQIKGHLLCRITNVWTQRYQKSPDAGFSGIFLNSKK